MNFTVIREHREFFRKHHWIECDGILSGDEQHRLSEGISAAIAERIPQSFLFGKAFDKNPFNEGRDLWRQSSAVKKVALSRQLAGIAGELTEKKPLRFGYDTLFPAVSGMPAKNAYETFLQTTPTLEEMSCIQGILCGAMLCISGVSENVTEDTATTADVTTTTLFSKTPGNAVFFEPNWPLPLKEIYQNPGFTYLLIVYTQTNAVYLSQSGDPHVHQFKNLGYNFGDRLKDSTHPIVYQ